MKRTIAVILSLYILMLAVLPCLCAGTHGHATAATAEVSSAADCGTVAGDMDFCSPFCPNVCCQHPPVITPGYVLFTFRPFAYGHRNSTSLYTDSHTCGFYADVWRPPIAA